MDETDRTYIRTLEWERRHKKEKRKALEAFRKIESKEEALFVEKDRAEKTWNTQVKGQKANVRTARKLLADMKAEAARKVRDAEKLLTDEEKKLRKLQTDKPKVLETLRKKIRTVQRQRQAAEQKQRRLEDCTSPVGGSSICATGRISGNSR